MGLRAQSTALVAECFSKSELVRSKILNFEKGIEATGFKGSKVQRFKSSRVQCASRACPSDQLSFLNFTALVGQTGSTVLEFKSSRVQSISWQFAVGKNNKSSKVQCASRACPTDQLSFLNFTALVGQTGSKVQEFKSSKHKLAVCSWQK
jgi:hypothetical protein